MFSIPVLLGLAALTNAIAIPVAEPAADLPAFCEGDMSCHVSCGGMARNGRTCSVNGDYQPPFNHACLCDEGSEFLTLLDACFYCGWSLWDGYAEFIVPALQECGLPTEPTGPRCDEEETTAAPTTEEPTTAPTEEPTTAAPTTDAPTTQEPTTDAPTTQEPTTQEPTTDAPTTQEPTTDAPTTAPTDATSAAPSGDETTSSDEPAVTSSSVEVSLAGAFNGNTPEWAVTVPGALGPWTQLSLVASKEGDFDYTTAAVYVNGEINSEATIEVTAEAISVVFNVAVSADDVVTISYAASEITVVGSSATSRATVTITTPDAKLVKRATQVFELESTITLGEDASSASDSSATSEEAGVSSASSNVSVLTKSDIGTTVVTITSCEADKCHETAVTTGVTVVTTTVHGTVTEYTTYCPLTTESKPSTAAPAPTTKAPAPAPSPAPTTKAPAPAPSPAPAPAPAPTTVTSQVTIHTFSGAAGKVAAGSTFVAFLFSLLLI